MVEFALHSDAVNLLLFVNCCCSHCVYGLRFVLLVLYSCSKDIHGIFLI